MKDLNQLADGELLSIVKTKAENERQLTLEVIELLREIQTRRLHLKRGYSSLHEFCVKELKYSDGSAFRRIKAMKLVEEMPEVGDSIQSGSLNLTIASQLQSAFERKAKEQAPLTTALKIELVNSVKNQSRREAERTIAKVCPEVIQIPEKIKAVNESQFKVELLIEGNLLRKFEKLKALTSHKNKNLVELLEDLVDQELKRRDPELKTSKQKSTAASPAKTNMTVARAEETSKCTRSTRWISSSVKRFVWTRDRAQCTFVDPLTKRKCESKHKLTLEHIQPFSMGGGSHANNLRLLCANHNMLTAINVFGKTKMDSFIKAKMGTP